MAIAACGYNLVHAKKLAILSAGEVIPATVEISDDGAQSATRR
jgi:hypothetical protein